MLPRNPFFIRQTEKIESVSSFLTLFNPKIVSFITQDDIEKTILYRSTPGGGKSTIFRLFSPSILSALVNDYNNVNYKECYEFLNNIHVIKDKQVKLLGVYVPCARNYSIIDDIYMNGKRLQVFFALLNLRIITSTLRNILELTNGGISELSKITFKNIPDELNGQINNTWSGKEIYEWAVEEENRLCLSIDDLEDKPSVPFAHNILSSLYLIEASNILYDGKNIIEKTLLMFDDVHKLTSNQRKEMLNCIFQIRPNIGVWIAERCSALDNVDVLGSDGKMGREYEERRIEDILEGTASFHKSLIDIADRRVRVNHSDSIGSFASCIEEELDFDEETISKIEKSLSNLKSQVLVNNYNLWTHEYLLNNPPKNKYHEAIFYREIKILIDRAESNPQLSIISRQNILQHEFEKEQSKLKSSAEYYLCVENMIPYYFGSKKLCELSFDNVEQFLSFAGEVFERRIALNYSSKKKSKSSISASDQEKIYLDVSKEKWDDIPRQYTNGGKIQEVLSNICFLGKVTREKAHASYGGGTYTGIGVREDILNSIVSDIRFKEIIQILYTCVTANLLKVKTVTQGAKDEKWKVFYLNRWICLKYNLPFQQGGWKRLGQNNLLYLLSEPEKILNNIAWTQYSLLDGEN